MYKEWGQIWTHNGVQWDSLLYKGESLMNLSFKSRDWYEWYLKKWKRTDRACKGPATVTNVYGMVASLPEDSLEDCSRNVKKKRIRVVSGSILVCKR